MSAPSVLFVPCATERVAATRVRITQYLPFIERAGIRDKIFPIVSDETTKRMLVSPTIKGAAKLLYYARVLAEKLFRYLGVLLLAGRYDMIFFQRTSFPFGLEKLIRIRNPKILFDFDDSIFMADPDAKEFGWIGALKDRVKASEVAGMVSASRLVVAGNDFLKEYADRHSNNVVVAPETIDTERYFVKRRLAQMPVNIGWIGSPSTSAYLRAVEPVLKRLAASHGVRIRLIGAGDFRFEGLEIDSIPWSYETEISELQTFDIGLMPQPRSDWAEGKFGSKMLQYMAVGVPAVISHSRANASVIVDGVNGFMASDDGEWHGKLLRLIEDPVLRERLGLAGRRTMEERFSLQARGSQFVDLLKRCAA